MNSKHQTNVRVVTAEPIQPPRLQQRTNRSFAAPGPPDALAAWLMDAHNFVVAPRPERAPTSEYGRLGRYKSLDDRYEQLIVLYWSGSVLCQGADALGAAALLLPLVEPSPAQAGLFDDFTEAR